MVINGEGVQVAMGRDLQGFPSARQPRCAYQRRPENVRSVCYPATKLSGCTSRQETATRPLGLQPNVVTEGSHSPPHNSKSQASRTCQRQTPDAAVRQLTTSTDRSTTPGADSQGTQSRAHEIRDLGEPNLAVLDGC